MIKFYCSAIIGNPKRIDYVIEASNVGNFIIISFLFNEPIKAGGNYSRTLNWSVLLCQNRTSIRGYR